MADAGKNDAAFDWSVQGPLDDWLEKLRQQQLADERETNRQEYERKTSEEQQKLVKKKKANDRQKLYDTKIEQFKPSKYSGNNRGGMVAMRTLSAQVRSEMKRRQAMQKQLDRELAEMADNPITTNMELETKRQQVQHYRAHMPSDVASLFAQIDVDGNKTLDQVEWLDGLTRLGVDFSKEEIELTFSLFDVNGDGQMSYEEFAKIMSSDSIKDAPSHPQKKETNLNRISNRRSSNLALRRKSMVQRVQEHSKTARHHRIQRQSNVIELPSLKGASRKISAHQPETRLSVLPPGRGPRNRLSRFRVQAIEAHARANATHYKLFQTGGNEQKVGQVLLTVPTRPPRRPGE